MPTTNDIFSNIISSVLTSIIGVVNDMSTAITAFLLLMVMVAGIKVLGSVLESSRFKENYGLSDVEEGRAYEKYKERRDRQRKFKNLYDEGK